MELTFDGYRFQSMMKSSESDDGCTSLWTHLMPLNCTLKMAKMVDFIFYHNEKCIRGIFFKKEKKICRNILSYILDYLWGFLPWAP